jgi:hypothetical protein
MSLGMASSVETYKAIHVIWYILRDLLHCMTYYSNNIFIYNLRKAPFIPSFIKINSIDGSKLLPLFVVALMYILAEQFPTIYRHGMAQ